MLFSNMLAYLSLIEKRIFNVVFPRFEICFSKPRIIFIVKCWELSQYDSLLSCALRSHKIFDFLRMCVENRQLTFKGNKQSPFINVVEGTKIVSFHFPRTFFQHYLLYLPNFLHSPSLKAKSISFVCILFLQKSDFTWLSSISSSTHRQTEITCVLHTRA